MIVKTLQEHCSRIVNGNIYVLDFLIMWVIIYENGAIINFNLFITTFIKL